MGVRCAVSPHDHRCAHAGDDLDRDDAGRSGHRQLRHRPRHFRWQRTRLEHCRRRVHCRDRHRVRHRAIPVRLHQPCRRRLPARSPGARLRPPATSGPRLLRPRKDGRAGFADDGRRRVDGRADPVRSAPVRVSRAPRRHGVDSAVRPQLAAPAARPDRVPAHRRCLAPVPARLQPRVPAGARACRQLP